jgi:hypothetical protein
MADIYLPPMTFTPDGRISVFLAGSIEMGKAEDWQLDFIKQFQSYNINILNPRRSDWDSSWVQSIDNEQFRSQVEWELDCLTKADLILMYLQPNTLSPISMLELGLYAHSNKLVVCCPDGFWRKGNIDIVCKHHKLTKVEEKNTLFEYAANYFARYNATPSINNI